MAHCEGKLQINLFGTLDVRINGQPLPPLRSVKGQHLFALLILRHEKEASRHWLAETLWPDSLETQAGNSLRQSLADLREALGEHACWLTSTNKSMLRLDLAQADVDIIQFDKNIKQGNDTALKYAVSLYRGHLLEGVNEAWVLLEREERFQSYIKALQTLANSARVEGDTSAEVSFLRLAVKADPLRETAPQALMQTLARIGDAQAALEVYQDLRHTLYAVGAQPSPTTTAVYNSIRQSLKSVRPAMPAKNIVSKDTFRKDLPQVDSVLGFGEAARSVDSSTRDPSTEGVLISAIRISERRTGNMPFPLCSLIGREENLHTIKVILLSHRLVSLVGSGGVGKTRLATQAANDLADDFAEGVWFLDLSLFDTYSGIKSHAPLVNAASSNMSSFNLTSDTLPGSQADTTTFTDRIVQELMTLLRVSEQKGRSRLETLVEILGKQRLLIVLDNCEGMVDACAHISKTLLSSCPNIHILATSRQRLGLNSEKVYPVPPLALPDANDNSLTALTDSPAAQLFLERTQAVRPTFVLTTSNALFIREICSRLDGLPLALELVAALADMLTPAELARRLHDRFALLDERDTTRPSRHQTLRAVIASSVDLLTKDEGRLLYRLSIFTGGWTFEAAEAICKQNISGDHESVFVSLRSLLNKSLVVAEESNGQMRYRMLESIREYAQEKLERTNENELLAARHLDFYVAMACLGAKQLTGPQQTAWLEKLELESGNLRSALTWAQSNSPRRPQGLELASALGRYWQIRGHFAEGCQTLQRLLEMPETQAVSEIRANALNWAGLLSVFQGNFAGAQSYCEQGYALWMELEDERGAAGTLGIQGIIAANRGELETARRFYGQALERARAAGDPIGIAGTLGYLGIVAATQGYYTEARSYYEESLALRKEQSDRWGIASSLNNLGQLARRMGDLELARNLLMQTLALRREQRDRRNIGITLNVLAHIAWQQNDLEQATICYMEALTLFVRLGDRRSIAYGLEMGARLAAAKGEAARAAQLCGAAQQLREELGAPLSPAEQQELDQNLQTATAQMGLEAFRAACEEGRRLKIDAFV